MKYKQEHPHDLRARRRYGDRFPVIRDFTRIEVAHRFILGVPVFATVIGESHAVVVGGAAEELVCALPRHLERGFFHPFADGPACRCPEQKLGAWCHSWHLESVPWDEGKARLARFLHLVSWKEPYTIGLVGTFPRPKGPARGVPLTAVHVRVWSATWVVVQSVHTYPEVDLRHKGSLVFTKSKFRRAA